MKMRMTRLMHNISLSSVLHVWCGGFPLYNQNYSRIFLSNRNIPTVSISNIHQMISVYQRSYLHCHCDPSDGIWEDMKEMRMHFDFGNDVEVSCLKGNDSS